MRWCNWCTVCISLALNQFPESFRRTSLIHLIRLITLFSLGHIVTASLVGKRGSVMSMSVCLSVSISRTTRPVITKFSAHVDCGRNWILHWRWCNTLCTSGAPVSWMTLCFRVISHIWRRDAIAAVSRQCCARTNTHAARYWLRTSCRGRQQAPRLDESFVQGVLNGST